MTDHSGIQHALGDAARRALGGLLAELSAFGPNQHTRLLRSPTAHREAETAKAHRG